MLPSARRRGLRHAVEAAGARPAGAPVDRRAADRTRRRRTRSARSLFAKTADIDRPVIDRTNDDRDARAGCSPAQVAMAWLLCKPAVTSPVCRRDASRSISRTRSRRVADAVGRGNDEARGAVSAAPGDRGLFVGGIRSSGWW